MPSKAAPPTQAERPVTVSGSSAADQARARELFTQMWPPKGWPMFACITRPSGTVVASTRDASGDQPLLKYDVRITEDGVYTIEILQGNLGREGDFSLTPALGIRFAGTQDWPEISDGDASSSNAVLEVYVGGQRLIPERGLILRIILAVTFLISRIDRGLAPNLKKTLKLYRLS